MVSHVQLLKREVLFLECEVERLKEQIEKLQERDIVIDHACADIPLIELVPTREDRLHDR